MYHHTFWCPVCAFYSSLASRKSIPKLNSHASQRIHHGLSSKHACSMAHVMSQYYVTFDDFKITFSNWAETLLPSAWQKQAGIVHEDKYEGKP